MEFPTELTSGDREDRAVLEMQSSGEAQIRHCQVEVF
jgi:hypothetical protein